MIFMAAPSAAISIRKKNRLSRFWLPLIPQRAASVHHSKLRQLQAMIWQVLLLPTPTRIAGSKRSLRTFPVARLVALSRQLLRSANLCVAHRTLQPLARLSGILDSICSGEVGPHVGNRKALINTFAFVVHTPETDLGF